MAIVFNFLILFIISAFMFVLFLTRVVDLYPYHSSCSFVNSIILFFSKLLIFSVCSFRDSQKVLMQCSPLYTLCLFFIPRNVHSVDIENPQGICLLTFIVDNFSRLFLHVFILLIKDLRSA